jgi:membrane fusion protein, heavy metal efflux system
MIPENKWVLLLMAAVTAPSWAAQPMGCLIEPERVAEVGSQVVGVIESMSVERGDLVKKGQVIATLRADVERASVVVASSRAEAQADLQAAAANLSFYQQRLVRAEDLLAKKFISQQAFDQTRTEAEVAEQKLAQAREQRRVLSREHELAAAQLSQRTIRSPIDGVVAERYLAPGERVEDKPLVRIAKVDPLRVQVVVPTAYFGKIQSGSTARIMPELPDTQTVMARVTLVDKVIDAASNTFRVQLELPNPDLALPAGLRCKADFGLEPPASRNTAQASPSPAAPVQPVALKTDNKLASGKPAPASAEKRAF